MKMALSRKSRSMLIGAAVALASIVSASAATIFSNTNTDLTGPL